MLQIKSNHKMSEIEKEELENSDDDKEEKEVKKIKSYTDIMKMKLDKYVYVCAVPVLVHRAVIYHNCCRLMANPDKPVFIPQPRKDKDVNKAPEFNHNIMGRLVSKDADNIHC